MLCDKFIVLALAQSLFSRIVLARWDEGESTQFSYPSNSPIDLSRIEYLESRLNRLAEDIGRLKKLGRCFHCTAHYQVSLIDSPLPSPTALGCSSRSPLSTQNETRGDQKPPRQAEAMTETRASPARIYPASTRMSASLIDGRHWWQFAAILPIKLLRARSSGCWL